MKGLKLKYFVLSPESSDNIHAKISRLCIRKYAQEVIYKNKELSEDLNNWMDRLDYETHISPD